MPNPKVALIVGAGPGLGAALGRRFSAADFAVALAARKLPALTEIANRIGPKVHA